MVKSNLNFNYTIFIPANYIPPTPLPIINSTPPVSRNSDTMNLRQQSAEGIGDFFNHALNAIVNFFKTAWHYFFGNHCQTTASPAEIARCQETQNREYAIWQRQMNVNLRPNRGTTDFVDLSGQLTELGNCAALNLKQIPQIGHYASEYPILNPKCAVKFPVRQLQQFPEAIRKELSSYDADHLDLYFIIWKDLPRDLTLVNRNDLDKRNLIYHPIAFPNAQQGEIHNHDLPMGIFDAEGIEMRHSDMGYNRLAQQNVHIHPQDQAMAISPDSAKFYLPANRPWSSFFSACKLPNDRAAAFFGIILNSNTRGILSDVLQRPLYRDRITLQEYLAGIQNSQVVDPRLKDKLRHIFSFHSSASV